MPICFVFSGNGCAETSHEKHAYQWLPSRFTETGLILPLTGRCNQSVGRCLIGLDALMPQTVVENACVCVLAITAAVPRGTPRIHIRVQVGCNAWLNLALALALRQANARRGGLLRTRSRPADRVAAIPAASGPFGWS